MPEQPIIRPSPNVPASKARKASRGSATLTAAFENMATFQAMSTVRSARERTVRLKPSFKSSQWPRLAAGVACSSRWGIPQRKTAEIRNVHALIQ